MQVDRNTGVVALPNALQISPALTQDVFRTLPAAHSARSRDCGTLPWIHYDLSGGHVDGTEIFASLCFYDQLLVNVSITADLYPPGPRDWSRYSLEVEAAKTHFHDRLLENNLGRPSKGASFLFHRRPKGQATLERPLRWDFAWGHVTSCHDSNGGGTYIVVSYGNRDEEASRAYRLR